MLPLTSSSHYLLCHEFSKRYLYREIFLAADYFYLCCQDFTNFEKKFQNFSLPLYFHEDFSWFFFDLPKKTLRIDDFLEEEVWLARPFIGPYSAETPLIKNEELFNLLETSSGKALIFSSEILKGQLIPLFDQKFLKEAKTFLKEAMAMFHVAASWRVTRSFCEHRGHYEYQIAFFKD